jgi:hypothetical protein
MTSVANGSEQVWQAQDLRLAVDTIPRSRAPFVRTAPLTSSISARIEAPAIAELTRLFELQTNHRRIVLGLNDVGVVGRDHCTSYIREWMEREKD